MAGSPSETGVYVDTSALGRVLLNEPDAAAIVGALASFELLVASRLLRVELCRLALRHNLLAEADQLLAGVALVPLSGDVLAAAETIGPSSVATLDAIHLVTALQLAHEVQIRTVMTYDTRLADAAHEHGLRIIAPSCG